MTEKIIYFTAGPFVTEEEQADIDALNALCEPRFELQVHNSLVLPGRGHDSSGDPIIEACDYVAGAVPDEYDGIGEIDPDAPPPPIEDDEAIVSDGQQLEIGENTYTFSVVDGAITGISVE